MADKVQADYEQLEQISGQFSTQSDTVHDLTQTVRSSLQQLEDGGWIGGGADSFYSEMHSVIFPTLQKLINALNDGANTTRQVAQKLAEAEEESQSLFVF
jgi:WXG100 family type VII secretion target